MIRGAGEARALLAGLCLLTAHAVTAQPDTGFAVHSPELRRDLSEALAVKGPDYEPRTEHLDAEGRPLYTNRLILATSPYLTQHAHNPVDWYPWGDEAFEKAARENKPVFLSIGYSTCHWCHVMERESFDNEEIGRLMGELFVCIKVDREERPDIDEIYMTAVQLMGQRGGWPMSSFLTPEREPFFGATYFPPAQFRELLARVDQVWKDDPDRLIAQAKQITLAVQQTTAARGEAQELGTEALERARTEILSRQDPVRGGYEGAPKFPHESELLFLLDTLWREERADVLAAVTKSLDHMSRGGIYDQVGGGFHRYSTDAEWLVPHFEKMLYNQAQLARAYVAAWQITGDTSLRRTARQTLDYVLREMRRPDGAFYSATDADSEGEEGLFFVWREDELASVLGEEAGFVGEIYGTSSEGNFEGRNILHLPSPLEKVAAARGDDLDDLLRRLDAARGRLLAAREEREHPLRDEKVLLAWNGMMVTALADAGVALRDPGYVEAARKAAETLWTSLRRGDGRLFRIDLDGRATTPAMQEDHAYFAEGLVSLYDATGAGIWLERAEEVSRGMVEQFWDAESGGFFITSADVDPHLIARPKSPRDGAIPSGNSVALNVLAQLYLRTGEARYRKRGYDLLRAFSSNVEHRPSAHAYLLRGAAALFDGEAEPRRYAAAGRVRVDGRHEAGGEIRVALEIAEGWHVNSASPLEEDLIPLRVEATSEGSGPLAELVFPEPIEVSLRFQETPLSIYEGSVDITARLGAGAARVAEIEVTLQACNDEACLEPETILLRLPRDG